MLTANQLCVLYPNHVKDQLNNNLRKRSPRRCLFGSPDPLDTKRMLEEQFQADREMMLRKYSFDILTSRPVSNLYSTEMIQEDEVTITNGVANSFNIPSGLSLNLTTENEVEDDRNRATESEVRHRPGRHSPYNRQTRITDFWLPRKNSNQDKINRMLTSNCAIQRSMLPQDKL